MDQRQVQHILVFMYTEQRRPFAFRVCMCVRLFWQTSESLAILLCVTSPEDGGIYRDMMVHFTIYGRRVLEPSASRLSLLVRGGVDPFHAFRAISPYIAWSIYQQQ